MFKNLLILTAISCLAACNEPVVTQQAIQHFYAPPTHTVIASDSMKIQEDVLNDMYYSIRITANDSSNEGYYDLEAAYGYNEVASKLRYPKLDKLITPAIRREDSIPYSYIVGFYLADQPEFKDYARVSARIIAPGKRQIELRYLKAYFMDSTGTKNSHL